MELAKDVYDFVCLLVWAAVTWMFIEYVVQRFKAGEYVVAVIVTILATPLSVLGLWIAILPW